MNTQNDKERVAADKGEGRKMVGIEETLRSGPWIYVRTHVNSYAVVADYLTSNDVKVRRYIAQFVPDLEIARLFTYAREMRALLEDVAEYIADGLVDEGAGYQDIEGQSLYREINDLLGRLEK
jgi:hypothetical protein